MHLVILYHRTNFIMAEKCSVVVEQLGTNGRFRQYETYDIIIINIIIIEESDSLGITPQCGY